MSREQRHTDSDLLPEHHLDTESPQFPAYGIHRIVRRRPSCFRTPDPLPSVDLSIGQMRAVTNDFCSSTEPLDVL
jgi:hypothetical protein